MTLANPSFPRRSYAANRRCSERRFFIRPSRKTDRVLGYCLGRGENLWAPGGAKRSAIFGLESLWEQLVYCTVNPTKDGLVETPEAWPGLLSLPEDVGTKTFRFERPDRFFRSEGDDAMPDVVEFVLEIPVELEHMPLETFHREYRRRLDAEIARVHAVRRGKPFMGAQQIRDQNPKAAAGDTFPDRDRDPRVCCRSREKRRGILRWLSEFRLAHTVAWFFWSRGNREAVFPAYTDLMRTRYRVRCRDPGLFSELHSPSAA